MSGAGPRATPSDPRVVSVAEPGTTPSGPRVVLANHWHDDNRGDSAITQGILTLLAETHPSAQVEVRTLWEPGALGKGAFRHLTSAFPRLVTGASPVPTELRGRALGRTRWQTARDAAIFAPRLTAEGGRALVGRGGWAPVLRGADLVVLVGGSNVFDDAGVPAVLSLPRLAEVLSPARAAVRLGVPVTLLGHTLGPFARPGAHRLAGWMLAGVDRAVVREVGSLDVARGLGLTAEEAPDLAFALPPRPSPAVESALQRLPVAPRRVLGLSIRQHPTRPAADGQRLVGVLAAAVRQLVAEGLADGVVVVPHTTGPTPVEDDREISAQLEQACRGIPCVLLPDDLGPAELSAFYGALGCVVAVRLHAAILALAAGTPTFALAYLTAKTHGVMAQAGLPDAVADYHEVTTEQVVAGVRELVGRPDLRAELVRRAEARRAALRERAHEWFALAAGTRADRAGMSAGMSPRY